MSEQTAETKTQSRCVLCEATDALGRLMSTMGPSEEITSHFRHSGVEFLKGVRAVLDAGIDRLAKSGQPHKGTRVTVE